MSCKTESMASLDYENEVFLELFHEDGLVVLAKGLGIERLLINLVRTFSDSGSLVLVIGTNGTEEEYFMNKARDMNISPLPKIITSEFGTKERHDIYMDGGVLFVSTQILVVDMLIDRIPIHLITGIIVYRAHKILESCQEAFCIRLYRMKNKKGFIKALSSNACAFTRGFSQVQRIMRNLFVRKLFIWPRFHAVVGSSFEKIKPEVIELHVSMTHSMQSIQLAILDLIAVSVKELKKINPSLDTDELTVENTMAKAFDKIIKYQLDPVWHQLSSKTRRLVSDLKFLRSVLRYLTQYDCVSFYNYLKTLKENVTVGTQISDWLFMDASETLFLHAKQRLYTQTVKKKKTKKGAEIEKDLDFECNPKWNTLSDILKEIADEVKTDEKEMVVVVVEDEVIGKQLQDVLTHGAKSYLLTQYKKLISRVVPTEDSCEPSADEQTLTQMVSRASTSTDDVEATMSKDDAKECEENILLKCSNIFVEFYPLKHGVGSHFRFQTLLELHHVRYVVLYDADMEIIRRIEVHQAANSLMQLKIYYLVYTTSAEEQCYLTILRREKEAFEFLIKEKAHMVLPESIEGKIDEHPDLVRGSDMASETVNTRQAGGQSKSTEIQKIIVDIREFRSELPSLIHRRGIDVIPVTIEVGDYILTPDICIERKSVSDLIGSLNSGRLYTQAQAMCRLYKRPILLIEFDENKAFSLQGKYYSGGNTPQSVTSKLILLTTHFPSLRILWCTSPYASAEMFELLKINREQPNAEQAMQLRPEGMEGEFKSEKYNSVAREFISRLPGLNSKNMWPLMNKLTSIVDLVNKSEEELSTILGNSAAAKVLWNCVNIEVKMEAQGAVATSKKTKRQWKTSKKKAQ